MLCVKTFTASAENNIKLAVPRRRKKKKKTPPHMIQLSSQYRIPQCSAYWELLCCSVSLPVPESGLNYISLWFLSLLEGFIRSWLIRQGRTCTPADGYYWDNRYLDRRNCHSPDLHHSKAAWKTKLASTERSYTTTWTNYHSSHAQTCYENSHIRKFNESILLEKYYEINNTRKYEITEQ